MSLFSLCVNNKDLSLLALEFFINFKIFKFMRIPRFAIIQMDRAAGLMSQVFQGLLATESQEEQGRQSLFVDGSAFHGLNPSILCRSITGLLSGEDPLLDLFSKEDPALDLVSNLLKASSGTNEEDPTLGRPTGDDYLMNSMKTKGHGARREIKYRESKGI